MLSYAKIVNSGQVSNINNNSNTRVSSRKKNRAELVDINELLKLHRGSSGSSLSAQNAESSQTSNRERLCFREQITGKRAVSSNFDESRHKSESYDSRNHSTIINRALSQILTEFKEESKLAERLDHKTPTFKHFSAERRRDLSVESSSVKRPVSSHFSDLRAKLSFTPRPISHVSGTSKSSKETVLKQKPPTCERTRDILKEARLGKRTSSSSSSNKSEHFMPKFGSQTVGPLSMRLFEHDLKQHSKSKTLSQSANSNERSRESFKETNSSVKRAVSSHYSDSRHKSDQHVIFSKPDLKFSDVYKSAPFSQPALLSEETSRKKKFDPHSAANKLIELLDRDYPKTSGTKQTKSDRSRPNAKIGLKINPDFGKQRASSSNNDSRLNANTTEALNVGAINIVQKKYPIVYSPTFVQEKDLNAFSSNFDNKKESNIYSPTYVHKKKSSTAAAIELCGRLETNKPVIITSKKTVLSPFSQIEEHTWVMQKSNSKCQCICINITNANSMH